ncbi:MAG: B12-binding domain-containing radical SAM protein [Desulfomonilaceae bacterium]
MKLLLLNPELPLSLMSFPSSCQIMGVKSFTPPLGLITVAAFVPDSWEVRLVDLNCTDISEEDWQWAEVVLISGMLLHSRSLLSLVREAKAQGKFVVCGGPYVSSMPEPALEAGADILVRGEAENLVDEILEAIKAGRSELVIQGSSKPDITGSPLPRFDLLNFSNYISMAIQTSRGCPFECEFCDVINLYGRKMRYKATKQVVAELDALYRLGWTGLVFVSDDNFIGGKTNARAILQEMLAWSKSHGEPFGFIAQASLNLAADPDMIDLMTEANFSFVFVGVESPDRSVLEHNRKRQNIENPLIESLRVLNARGLQVIASFVIGFDGEEKGVDERIVALADAAELGMVLVNLLQAMPNTKLWNRLQSEGRLLPRVTSGETLASRMNFVPSRPLAEIVQEWAGAWSKLYEPDRCLERIFKGFLSMRPTRSALGLEAKEHPASQGPDTRRKAVTRFIQKMKSFGTLVRLMGLRPSSAHRFWKNILIMWKKHPSRLMQYLDSCGFAANMFLLRDEIQKRSAANIQESCDPTDPRLNRVARAQSR